MNIIEKLAKVVADVPVMAGTYSIEGKEAEAIVRAVLTALREPTEAMKSAVNGIGGLYGDDLPAVLNAAIDAALAEG